MNIAVYCSAKDTIPTGYKRLGRALGAWIAAQGHTLVFGGATGGLMTEVSKTVFESGGKVTGVVTKRIIAAGRRSPYCTSLIETDNMNERKQIMKQTADCFVCLPGSYGTLDEMFDVIASGTVGEHRKPIYILNHRNFYRDIMREAEHMRKLTFIPEQETYKPIFINSLSEIYELISQQTNRETSDNGEV